VSSYRNPERLRPAHEPRSGRGQGGNDRYGVFSPATSLDLHPVDDEGNVRYRKLGLIVARGTLLVVISPVDGSEEIANPFMQEEE
jgi:hypothetical protein